MKSSMYACPHKYQCAGTAASFKKKKKKREANHPPKAITRLQWHKKETANMQSFSDHLIHKKVLSASLFLQTKCQGHAGLLRNKRPDCFHSLGHFKRCLWCP